LAATTGALAGTSLAPAITGIAWLTPRVATPRAPVNSTTAARAIALPIAPPTSAGTGGKPIACILLAEGLEAAIVHPAVGCGNVGEWGICDWAIDTSGGVDTNGDEVKGDCASGVADAESCCACCCCMRKIISCC